MLPRRGVLALLALVPLLGVSPEAQAQAETPRPTLALDLRDPAMALPPGSQAVLEVHGSYAFPAGAVGEPDADVETRNGSRPTRVTFSIAQIPSWIAGATIEPAEIRLDPPLGHQAGGERGRVPFGPILVRVDVAPDAPATRREPIVVSGVAHANGAIPEARAASGPLPLRAAEVGRVEVVGPAAPVVLAGGRWHVVAYTVSNLGNRETTVLLNVTIRPERSQVEAPQEILLAPGEAARVDVRIRTPWTEAEEGVLTLSATPLLAEGDEGPPASHSADVRGRSAVPAPAPGGLLLAILGAGASVAGRPGRHPL